MQDDHNYLPLDKATIRTRVRIDSRLFDDPNTFIRERGLAVLTVKATQGASGLGTTHNVTLDVLKYGGIKAKIRKVAGVRLADVTIRFNPGVCLYGHNGYVCTPTEFLDALGLLVQHLAPLLGDPDDQVDLLPGLRAGGVAYWESIEVLIHCADPDRTLLERFCHARHPEIRTPIRRWPTSLEIGGKRSKLQIVIYRKAEEMAAHKKLPHGLVPDYNVLRIEVRLKEEKLVKYLGNGRNVEEIGGVQRLVRFYPGDLVRAHREIIGEVRGVFLSGDPSGEVKLVPMGRMLAQVALDPRSTMTFPELLSHLRFYTGASPKTIRSIRDAGNAELSRRSPISAGGLLSDEAYQAQHGVASERLEQMVCHDFEGTEVFHLINDAYRPPSDRFKFITELPRYDRANRI